MWRFHFIVALLFAGILNSTILAQDEQEQEEKEPPTIKEIMKTAHKDGLVKKAATGKASDEEKTQLVELYKYLAEATPPRGEQKSWDEKTKALVDAATAVQKYEKNASKLLSKASNCTDCHKVHK